MVALATWWPPAADVAGDLLVQGLDVGTQVLRVEVGSGGGEGRELGGDVERDDREVVADDPAGLAVPERRHRDVAGVAGFGGLIRFREEGEAVDRVGLPALPERPAARVAGVVDVGERHDVLESGQVTDDGDALGPRADVGEIEVVAARLGRVAAGAVGGDPVLERVDGAVGLPVEAARSVGAEGAYVGGTREERGRGWSWGLLGEVGRVGSSQFLGKR